MSAATAAWGEMPLAEHAREARRRATRAAVALLIGAIVAFAMSDGILDILREPIEQIAQSRNASLNYDSVTGAFDLKLRIALIAGVVLSSPVWLFELFRFIAPGLTRRERRRVTGYTVAAILLFVTGCVFGFFVFPHMVEVLASFASAEDSTILQASTYVDFVLKTIVATGLAFVLPIALVMVNALGIVSAAGIRRGWRYVLVAIAVFSALVTPAADVMSMFLIAVPVMVLYAAALVITHLHDRRIRGAAAPAHPMPPLVTTKR